VLARLVQNVPPHAPAGRTGEEAIVKRLAASMLVLSGLAGILGCVGEEPEIADLVADEAALSTTQATLHTWWHPTREDNYTTSDPAWAGSAGAVKDGYSWVRNQGRVFSPAQARPPQTVALHQWWSATRGDNLLTSDPAWAPGTVHSGYVYVRLEGFVFDSPRASTVALASMWNPTRGDNFASTDPSWHLALGASRDGYTHFRDEGYVIVDASAAPVLSSAAESSWFGYNSRRLRGKQLRGERPLLGLRLEFNDRRFVTPGALPTWLFGPSYPNARALYSEMSGNLFTWSNAGNTSIKYYTDDPATTLDESSYECTLNTKLCSALGFGLVVLRSWNNRCGAGANASCYLSATAGGGGGVTAQISAADATEVFSLEDLGRGTLNSGDQIALRSAAGYYLGAVGGGGGEVRMTAQTVGTNERWTVDLGVSGTAPIGNDTWVYLRTASGYYLTAVDGGGGGVHARSTATGNALRFKLSRAMSTPHIMRTAIQRAAVDGFDFARFDSNGDHRVTQDELSIVVQIPGTGLNASVRLLAGYRGCFPVSTVDVCDNAALVDEGSGFTTTAHELGHMLADGGFALDLYGSACNGWKYSLMSCTGATGTFHMDPWHKMQLGWVRPRIYRMDQPGGAAYLAAPSNAAYFGFAEHLPVLLYDPRAPLGVLRYLLIEYRRPNASITPSYDDSVPGTGMVVWDVQVNAANGNPIATAATSSFNGALEDGPTPASAPLWTAGLARQPMWVDGTLAATTLRGTAGPGGLFHLEWTGTTPATRFIPRVDTSSLDHATPSTQVVLTGKFGSFDAYDRVQLRPSSGGGIERPMTIVSWQPESVTFRVATGTPRGSYTLLVQDGWSGGSGPGPSFTVD